MFRISLLLLIIIPGLHLYAGTPPRVEKQPGWISSTQVSYTDTQMDQEAEDGYVNVDFEKQVCLDQQAVYYKKVTRILSEAGVQNNAQISVSYDPSYQQLVFHTLRIIRNGSAIDKLQISKFKTVQQEKELNRFIYNGKLTAVLILDDVRKGDVIEYSYTIKGFNPIFAGKYADNYDVQFGVPVYHLLYKLIVPSGRTITIKNSLTDIRPAISSADAETSYEWSVSNVNPVHAETDLPGWYNPYATVMVSEYKNWKEVNDWALGLFPAAGLSPALEKKVNDIKSICSTPEERTLAALRFVQDDIRYMGIEKGVNTHKPHTPSEIFAQRFGDCKDKTYLLCTMLHAMGITADPVLINTDDKKTILNWLPASNAFDHATVHVIINGKTYWFDPTISNQRGDISHISFPDYQVGLVLTTGTTALTNIPLQDKGRVEVKEVFHARDKNGPARLVVTSTYTGSFADDLRSDYKANSLYELKKSSLNFYAAWFGRISMDSLAYAEDEATGAFITKEYYKIDSFWINDKGTHDITFEPYVISSIIKKPKDRKRAMPYALDFPAVYHEEIEVDLPYEYNAEEFAKNVKTDAFNLSYHYASSGSKLLLDYKYNSNKDHVIPADTDSFLPKHDDANESIAYTLGPDNTESVRSTPVDFSFHSGYEVLYIILGACVGITYWIKKKKKADVA